MLTNPTLDHMYTLGLSGMAAAWRELAEQPNARAMEKEEWLGLMLDREIAVRADKRLTARLVAAKLRFPEACVEDIDFHAARNLDRRATMALAQGQWLKNHEKKVWLRSRARIQRSAIKTAPSILALSRGFFTRVGKIVVP